MRKFCEKDFFSILKWGKKFFFLLEQRPQTHGGYSQNFLGKFKRFFVTLRCFYRVVIHRK